MRNSAQKTICDFGERTGIVGTQGQHVPAQGYGGTQLRVFLSQERRQLLIHEWPSTFPFLTFRSLFELTSSTRT